jgi:PrsW family intramembrane metalloprotease
MTTPGSAAQPPKSRTEWGSIGQLLVSGLAALGCLTLVLILLISCLIQLVNPNNTPEAIAPAINMAWSQALVGVLVTLSAALAVLRLLHRPWRAWPAAVQDFLDKLSPWSILAWPLVLAAGYGVSFLGNWAVLLLLPPLSLLAVALPVFWLAALGTRRLERASLQRAWGTLTTGLIVTPLLSTIAEVTVTVMLAIVGMLWLASHPQTLAAMEMLAQRVMNAQGNTQVVQRIMSTYLGRPAVYIPVLIIIAGLAPLIEELIKPLAVWLLAGRNLTPAQGFSIGIISGAGFTLVESLSKVTGFSGADWVGVMVGRAGTDLLHIVTTGIVGWALASAWSEKRYLRLGATYLLAVMLHAIWNALGVWTGFDPYIHPLTQNQLSGVVAPIGLGVLAVIMFSILYFANRRLRQNIP